eukprot:4738628-Pyramimonas_sp.AAC.1
MSTMTTSLWRCPAMGLRNPLSAARCRHSRAMPCAAAHLHTGAMEHPGSERRGRRAADQGVDATGCARGCASDPNI